MALVLADRVQQTGTANTTVSFTLSGSVSGFQSFGVVGNGNTTYYSAFDASGNWEVGVGTYSTTGPTLTRTTVLSSSNSGSAVTFSGTVNVFVTYPSEKSVNLDASGNATALGTPTAFTATNVTGLPLTTGVTGTLPIANGGTNATTASAALTSLGAYPASNPSGYTNNTGTVTSVNLTAGTGVSVSGGPVTGSGSITVNNTGVTSVAAGTGISVSASTGGVTITNTASAGLPGLLGQVFTASGTFTIPTGVTAIKATVVGGGGSGPGGVGPGGGAGGTAISYLTGLTSGNTLSITIGAGGAASSSTTGNAGGNSTVASGTQTISTITGGGAGVANTYSGSTTGNAGPGGTATGGTLNIKGGGGASANYTDGFSGSGGNSILGGGANAPGCGGNGAAGIAGGANTGGGGTGGGSGVPSGAGGSGVVIFEW